jgi:predicted amidohydrolase YtcJ
LLSTNGILPLGTDFPVENIYPLETYFAAVYRTKNGSPAFQPQDALTPEEAIKGMTYWAAYSCFEEEEKGSLAIGQSADFTILNKSLENATKNDFESTKVISTFINGKKAN